MSYLNFGLIVNYGWNVSVSAPNLKQFSIIINLSARRLPKSFLSITELARYLTALHSMYIQEIEGYRPSRFVFYSMGFLNGTARG